MKVAIAGYGLEGQTNYKYWLELGADVTIFDERANSELNFPEGAKTVLGPDCFQKLDGFDLVIRTASLRIDKIKTDGKIWSATNEFFEKCPASIIGVTGTKGKGTTASLIAEILSRAGRDVHLVGNIGVPALKVLPDVQPDDIVVFELSSFQLWDIKKSPQTAVVLMIEPDHLDVHNSVEEYVMAKANITIHQDEDDLLVYHPTNKYSAQIAEKSPAKTKRFMTPEGAYIIGGQIVIDNIAVCKVDEVGLVGQHNLENICAALTAVWKYEKNVSAIQPAIKDFNGLPHRLEFVRELDGVKYYNDSFSSSPGATIAAIKSFEQPEILICGGYNKNIDFTELAESIARQKNIKKILLIGETKEEIAQNLNKVGFQNYEVMETKDFQEIVNYAKHSAENGDIVLLSPGCASFDMFKNFYERGEQFKQLVNQL